MTETRKYVLKRRAETQSQTRRRITEAAVELHGTVGPARTTISAVAERAGVQRLTVYRHFPDERALFAACSAHHGELHPPPDPAAWADIRTALRELYDYYGSTEGMLANLLRDEGRVPVVAEQMAAYHGFLRHARDQLAGPRASKRRRAAIGHALEFGTWRSLVRGQGLSRDEAVELMAELTQANGGQ